MVRRPFIRPFRDIFGGYDPFEEFSKIDPLEDFRKFMEDIMGGEFLTSVKAGEVGSPIVYGWSVEVGPDGVPRIETFGNVKSTPAGPMLGDAREPFGTTVVDNEKNLLYITVELPGISKEDVNLFATEDKVTVEAKNKDGTRKFYKEFVDIPPIDVNSAKPVYNNGVLDVTFKLKGDTAKKGKSIPLK
ncbi:MAG: Hsp20/alpha crystallin family protein [Methermicoccaceae archaeon]